MVIQLNRKNSNNGNGYAIKSGKIQIMVIIMQLFLKKAHFPSMC